MQTSPTIVQEKVTPSQTADRLVNAMQLVEKPKRVADLLKLSNKSWKRGFGVYMSVLYWEFSLHFLCRKGVFTAKTSNSPDHIMVKFAGHCDSSLVCTEGPEAPGEAIDLYHEALYPAGGA